MPTVSTEQLRSACNTGEQGHQGNYFTDSPKLATVCWRWKMGCWPCKTLSEARREVRGKGGGLQRKRAWAEIESRIREDGREAKDPRERKGRDGCVILLGRSHQGRPEAEDTLMMSSCGVEISIAGGGADEKDEEIGKRSPPLSGKEILPMPCQAQLIVLYESHIRVTKETRPFVVNITKAIPHSNCVTKERTPKKPILFHAYLTRWWWDY